MNSSAKLVHHVRLRFGLSQQRMADLIGVPPHRLAAWERGLADPDAATVAKLLDLPHRLPSELLSSLARAVAATRLPRALSRSNRLTLQAISGPAVAKRPDIVGWVGKDLAPIACGVLQSLLGDGAIQRAIKSGEITRVVTTTGGVLRTGGVDIAGKFRTTVNYVFHDGVLFSDAIAVPAHPDERIGYTPIALEELGMDLFGDHDALAAGMAARPAIARRPRQS